MVLSVLLLIFAVGTVVIASWLLQRSRSRRAAISRSLKEQFQLDDQHLSLYGGGFIGISFSRKLVVLGKLNQVKAYEFNDVTSFEIVRDGVNIVRVNRGSQLGGALVGDALFGPVGEILGGLTGSSRGTTNIKELVLKVVVRDNASPVYSVKFLHAYGAQGASPHSRLVRDAQNQIERFHAHLQNIFGERKLVELR